MVDDVLILKKLASLADYRSQLREYADISVHQYCSDWKVQRIVERTLQMMIELCTDIANHLIADLGLRTPQTYAETFRILGESDILASEQALVMEKMAKFRNIVVHQYEMVDAEIVVLILRKHLADFDSFSEAVRNQLKQSLPHQSGK